MPKKIVLLSDGTGNSSHDPFKTNVWRLYQALDLTQADQLACYDDGVGTSSFQPLALLGGAFGWGLKRNVLDLYTFLCRNYEPGDQIYCFGFSRGAFTARVLADLIMDQGVIQADTEADRQRLARAAFRANRWHYHKDRSWLNPFNLAGKLLRGVRDATVKVLDWLAGRPPYSQVPKLKTKIAFIGVWDTVAAYGLPIDELTRAWDAIFPISFPNQNLGYDVECARHALALDDERHSFHPELWNEDETLYPHDQPAPPGTPPLHQRLQQVWFAGMHSDVGGSYPDDAMSFVPLQWMVGEAAAAGLCFNRAALDVINAWANWRGPLHDSRRGVGGFYRYQPRKLELLLDDPEAKVKVHLPKIHQSVFDRIKDGGDGYAPIVLPAQYEIYPATPTPPESKTQALNRAEAQERVWDFVWRKRVTYFATVLAAFVLALFPLWRPAQPTCAGRACGLSPLIGVAGALLPGMLEPWLKAFQSHPGSFFGVLLLLIWLMKRSATYQRCIFDTMRSMWTPLLTGGGATASGGNVAALNWRLHAATAGLALWSALVAGFTYLNRLQLNEEQKAQPWFDRVVAHLTAPWLAASQAQPRLVLTVGVALTAVLVGLLLGKSRLQRRLFEAERGIWEPELISPTVAGSGALLPNTLIYQLRSNGWYQAVMQLFKRHVLPLLAGILAVWALLGGVGHFLFSMQEAAGSVCRSQGGAAQTVFPSNSPCWASGYKVIEGRRYKITLAKKTEWKDGEEIKPPLGGFNVQDQRGGLQVFLYAALLLRRHLSEPYFKPIARIGESGHDEYPLSPKGSAEPDKLVAEMTARRTGELFLYVNDAALPGRWQPFYINNHGEADVSLELLDEEAQSKGAQLVKPDAQASPASIPQAQAQSSQQR